MINGAHVIIHSKDAAADRAVHPSDTGDSHELYLMCDELPATIAELSSRGVACDAPETLGWGVRTRLALPGGSRLALYQPRHVRPNG